MEEGKISKIHKSDYPDYGNINVNPYLEFSQKNYDNISHLWICKFNQSELEEIEYKSKLKGEGRTKFKINGDELINNGYIYDINKEGIYEIGELIEDYIDLEEFIYNNDKIEIKNKPIKEKIYIKDSNYIYGPFGYKENDKGGGYYINKSSNDYIIQRYSINDNKEYINISEIELTSDYISSNVKIVYFHDKEKLVSETLDIINKEELLRKLKEIISIKNMKYSRKEIQEIRSNIKFIIDNSLSEVRINRIKGLIKNTEITDEFIENDLIEIIGLLLENEEKRNIIADEILEKPENLRKLQNVEIVQSNIENKKEELKKLQEEINGRKRELEEINIKNKNFTNKNINELIEKSNKDVKEMECKKEEIKKDIEKLSKRYELCEEIDVLYKTIDELKKKAKEAEDDYNVFTRKSQTRKNQAEKIEEEIKLKLKNATSLSQYSDIAFDGMIANEMLESAAKWIKGKYIEDFENSIGAKENFEKVIEVKSFKQDNVIDYIYNKINQNRDYSKNDVINIMICLTQGFLTVFAGEPGVGKTSLCNIIANVLGLSNENNDYNRFTEIAVEKGWTSKRDLIGYYNPLTKSFDKNNSSLFKTFNILDIEYKKGIKDFPYYVLLDEANLSSMEHYWADFMSVCDLDKENRKINLGEDYIYYIPKTLRFLATINYDHTTETLSPRLIDRAWIILLEPNNLEIEDYDLNLSYEQNEKLNDGIIMFEDINKYFSYSSYDNGDEETISPIYEELKKIYKMFSENNISISQRVDNMIKKYLKVGCTLFEDTNSTSHEFVALDYVIAQKMLPKINGYGDNYKVFLQNLEKEFNEKNMMKCKNIVESIIEKGNNNMQYYQFFV
ncbi:hypothetical protein [Haloimpatiens massiliensis]|uniref:hypothetical protein n=1 Tax=Haloimpatiens massiliensis TaxID=1658110 RepID=UPI000C844567|nr:hypothetical protein [Haloimpatiens massiliensis]